MVGPTLGPRKENIEWRPDRCCYLSTSDETNPFDNPGQGRQRYANHLAARPGLFVDLGVGVRYTERTLITVFRA